MLRAISLARKCATEPGRISPKVGAIVARDGKVLGRGLSWGARAGGTCGVHPARGETRDRALAGATLFTTLEPCTSRHHPKIACADRIVERRIKRVVIGVLDPNDRIRGRGELRLRAAGIEIARFDPDLMPQIEEQIGTSRESTACHCGDATYAETRDPVKPNEVRAERPPDWVHEERRQSRVDPRRRDSRKGVAAATAAQRQVHPEGVQRTVGQGLVEQASGLAAEDQKRGETSQGGSGADPQEGAAGGQTHREEIRQEESRMGRLRVGDC